MFYGSDCVGGDSPNRFLNYFPRIRSFLPVCFVFIGLGTRPVNYLSWGRNPPFSTRVQGRFFKDSHPIQVFYHEIGASRRDYL